MRRLGHYEVQRSLGAGGMGEVFLARDRRTGELVALKLLAPELAEDAAARARFVAEGNLGRAVDHPHLVTVRELGEAHLRGAQRSLFMAMELAPGRELLQILSVEEIPLTRIAEITVAVASALAALHGQGVVHRDVKSGNIKVSQDGVVKLLDLGLAAGTHHAEPGVVGTLHYAAPEQLQGNAVVERSDVYSLGVVVYQMLTGRLPFRGETPEQVVESVGKRRAKPIDRLVKGVPDEMTAMVVQMTEPTPEDRPETGEVERAFVQLAKELKARDDAASPDEIPVSRFRSWLRRRRLS